MAKAKSQSERIRESVSSSPLDDWTGGLEAALEGPDFGGQTGRMIVTPVDSGKAALDKAVKKVSQLTGISSESARVCSTADFDDDIGIEAQAMQDASFVRIEGLNVAIVNGDPSEIGLATAASPQDDGVIVEPEYWNVPLGMEATVEGLDDDQQTGAGDGTFDDGGRGTSRSRRAYPCIGNLLDARYLLATAVISATV